jgi:hypothetical protein
MQTLPAQPWWKFGHVWLVVSGPATVVVASFFTLYLAIANPDPVIRGDAQHRADEQLKPELGSTPNLAPAMQARNHAATGVPATSKP